MQAMDVNSLFAQAERAFVAGHLDQAQRDLVEVRRLAGDDPAVLHLLALVQKKRGRRGEARAAFEAAQRLAPGDPQINTNYGNLLTEEGEDEAALRRFDRALDARPGFADARFNRALLLQKLGRHKDALAELDRVAARAPGDAKVHSARGNLLRELRRLGEAAEAYELALAAQPQRLTAVRGRARIALERGEHEAVELHRRALALAPEDAELSLGLAEALEAAGEPGALEILERAVARDPEWVQGQTILARMRWEAGEGAAFARGFEQVLSSRPSDRELWFAYASALAAASLSREAADAAARARRLVGSDPALELLEAVHTSEAGDADGADRLFARLPEELPGRSLHEIRHRLRQGEHDRAAELADRARAENPWGVGAWALTGIIWRLLGDERAEWLHGRPGLVARRSLDLSAEEIAAIAGRLRALHRTRAHPIGQSLRGGTQTRGRLFDRSDPDVQRLAGAIAQALRQHWSELPPLDPGHPLLRHRDRAPRIEGSWSVRLTNGGFHVAHVHPQGLLSSACYLVVPAPQAPREGWLEIGRPPSELGLALEPLASVEPQPGLLALFPSTLYHGTRAFAAGERLTAAFDVVA